MDNKKKKKSTVKLLCLSLTRTGRALGAYTVSFFDILLMPCHRVIVRYTLSLQACTLTSLHPLAPYNVPS